MKIDELTLEQNSTERSTTYYNVASSYTMLKKHDKAIVYYLKALAIDEPVLGVEHEDVWAEHENLAIAYEKISKLDLSLKYWRKSLAYKEHRYGKDDADTNATRIRIEEIEKP